MEIVLIYLAAEFSKAPSGPCFVYFALAIPVLTTSLVFFKRFERESKRSRSQIARAQIIELQQQHDETIQRVMNPLEQSHFLIKSSDLTLVEKIGQGGCGWIYRATLGENTVVAAKEIISSVMNPEDSAEFEHEARMLTQMVRFISIYHYE